MESKKDYSYTTTKQIITPKYYKPYAKKHDYTEKANKETFLNQFLDDTTFLRLYKKMNKAQKKEIRQHRKRNDLESVYNKVKAQYEK